jgi:arylsulfatase A-like enzyme
MKDEPVMGNRRRKTDAMLRIVGCILILAAGFLSLPARHRSASEQLPNILWITSEDHGPHMGCYGDRFATTPNADAMAAKGMLYRLAWSNAPVCAPARTTIISGMYPPSTGSEHMRSLIQYPQGKQMFPQLLRQAGYYCTNNVKEDYNLEPPKGANGAIQVWNESSRTAHWRKRAAGQPFFSVFNSVKSHESQLRVRPHTAIHDPAQAPIPAYHPDTPEVRQDWAQYYDVVSEADADAGERLKELSDAGLAEDTIVFYYADHGSGMPRNKRWPYNSGLQVPFIVHIPEKFKHLAPPEYRAGGKSDRLISFVDLAPTVLSLAGVKPPEWMQGHAFMGKHQAPPQPFVYGFRGRMDERYDLVRSVTDGRYVYIRNYMPHLIYGQYLDYMFQTPTTRVWRRLYGEGKLKPPQTYFWEGKPAEELYDLQNDRDEVRNLAASPQHQEALAKLRQAQRALALKIRDVGFLPESELHRRSAGTTMYDLGHDPERYPLEKIMAMADLASLMSPDAQPQLRRGLKDGDSGVRYWAAMGLLMRGRDAVAKTRAELREALKDEAPAVCITAARALGLYGTDDDLKLSLAVLRELAPPDKNGLYASMEALNAVDALGKKAAGLADLIKTMAQQGSFANQRTNGYIPRLVEHILSQMGTTQPASRSDEAQKQTGVAPRSIRHSARSTVRRGTASGK